MISAIETEYNGTKYRSRTEARWARLFDAACTPFQYEPEGFQFSGERHDRYVPDFWLSELGCYLEVKHDGFDLLPGEWAPERCLCEHLNERTQRDVYLAPGSPDYGMELFHWSSDRVSAKRPLLLELFGASSIRVAKGHRFDWGQAPRHVFGKDPNSIGWHANSILRKFK